MKPEKFNDKVRCPNCRQTTDYSANNPYRPFCCYRCKLIDLGAWASESYKLPSSERSDPESEEDQ